MTFKQHKAPAAARRHSNKSRQHNYDLSSWHRLRKRIFTRDKYICKACGESVHDRGRKDELTAHCDHIKPVADGGTNEESNLQTLCASCHSVKTSQDNPGWKGAEP